MINTRITELFKIRHPVMLAGMNWITEPGIVSAVCNAGGLGVLALAQFTAEDARKNIRRIRELTDKPFGVNQALQFPTSRENISVAIEEKVPIINYSLGKPWFIDQVHAYGGKVVGTVAIARHAAKAEELGADAVVVTGHEAAAHGHYATSLVLIPIVRDMVKVPIIAAGGFYNGRGLAAALALGADAISMGSRFMLTRESIVHDNFKQLCLRASEQDTLYSDVFDGLLSRVLKTKAAEQKIKGGFPLTRAFSSALEVKKIMGLSLGQFILTSFKMARAEERLSLFGQARMADHATRAMKAINNGDTGEGILAAGQACGGIHDIPTCKELIERIAGEAEEVLENTRQKVAA